MDLESPPNFNKEIPTQPQGQGQIPMMPEPWAHRSEHLRCRTCMWYISKDSATTSGVNNNEMGRCRKHAPTMNGFPVVFAAKDWCGDHKLA